MQKQKARKQEATLVISKELHSKLKNIACGKGLKMGAMVSRGLNKIINEKPEFFLP